jgi:hypothetical protein
MDLGRYLSKSNIAHTDFVASLARYGVKVTTQAIRNWIEPDGRSNARKPSPKKVHAIEAATSGNVTRHDLRPDIYGPAPKRKRAA